MAACRCHIQWMEQDSGYVPSFIRLIQFVSVSPQCVGVRLERRVCVKMRVCNNNTSMCFLSVWWMITLVCIHILTALNTMHLFDVTLPSWTPFCSFFVQQCGKRYSPEISWAFHHIHQSFTCLWLVLRVASSVLRSQAFLRYQWGCSKKEKNTTLLSQRIYNK